MGNVIEITDFNAAELDVYARLTEAQLLNKDRPEDGIFIAESPKVIGRALDAGYEPVSFLAEKQHIDEGETGKILSCCGDIPVYIAEFDVLTQLTGYKLTRGCSAPCGAGHFRLFGKSAEMRSASPSLRMS